MSRREHDRAPQLEPVPYGLRVAPDHVHLEENPSEVDTMLSILEGLVKDWSMAQIALDLNRRGGAMRNGMPWSQSEVFQLLPRLIDFGPRLFDREEWIERRKAILRHISNGS